MGRRLVLVVVLVAGCRFRERGVPLAPASDLALAVDDAAVATGDDLAVGGDLGVLCPPVTVDESMVAATCVRGAVAPVVDGDLADWPGGVWYTIRHADAGGNSGTWGTDENLNDADLSASVAARWDDQYLYVAAKVTDDVRGLGGSNNVNDDAVEIYVDGLHDRDVAYEADDAELVFNAGGVGQMWKYGGTNPQPLPAGIVAAARDATPAASWTLEVALPWSMLGGTAAAPARLIGFDIQLDDNDGGATRARTLTWANAAPMGCTCAGTANPCEPYCDPQAFVALALAGP